MAHVTQVDKQLLPTQLRYRLRGHQLSYAKRRGTGPLRVLTCLTCLLGCLNSRVQYQQFEGALYMRTVHIVPCVCVRVCVLFLNFFLLMRYSEEPKQVYTHFSVQNIL
jgi:hypothetical protein